MADGVIIQVMLFAVLFGLAVSYVRIELGKNELYEVIKPFNAVIMRLMGMIMKVAPIGIFALMASTIGVFLPVAHCAFPFI